MRVPLSHVCFPLTALTLIEGDRTAAGKGQNAVDTNATTEQPTAGVVKIEDPNNTSNEGDSGDDDAENPSSGGENAPGPGKLVSMPSSRIPAVGAVGGASTTNLLGVSTEGAAIVGTTETATQIGLTAQELIDNAKTRAKQIERELQASLDALAAQHGLQTEEAQ